MASIQKKGDGWYCQFMHRRHRYTFAIGKVDEPEAIAVRSRVDYVLIRLKQGLLELPDDVDVVSFVQNGGRARAEKAAPPPATSYRTFRDAYLKTVGQGAIEANTLDTVKIHLDHFA